MADEYIRRDFALAGTELYKYGEMEIEAVAAEYIQRLPAADVAEVVRDRDCAKHYVVLGRDMCAKNASGLKDHLIGLSATLPDAFCSRGVRKDGGENDVSG